MYKSIQKIQKANESIGHRFFRNQWYCQVADPTVYKGIYFITQESLNIGSIVVPKTFTIRFINTDKTIGTLGQTGAYKTLEEAQLTVRGLE